MYAMGMSERKVHVAMLGNSASWQQFDEVAADKVTETVFFRQFFAFFGLVEKVCRHAQHRPNDGLKNLERRMACWLVMSEGVVVNQRNRTCVTVDLVTLLSHRLILPLLGCKLRDLRLDRLDIGAANTSKIIVKIQCQFLSLQPSMPGEIRKYAINRGMIITEKFVFIHMHKTGGQTLNDAITDCINDHRVVGYHFPRRMVPQEFAHLPVVGLVRNPWSWYVSWFTFNNQPNIRNSLFNIVSEDGQADFATTVGNLVNLGSDDEKSRKLRDSLISILPDTLDGNRGAGLTKQDIRDLGASDLGYFSWLFDRMLGIEPDANALIGRFENLRHDFLDIMQQLDVAEKEALAWAMDYGKRKNFSRHSHYSHYYTQELQQLVADKERPLIERFDYRFETVGPTADQVESKQDPLSEDRQGFHKLLGRADNFLQVNSDFDVEPLREKVLRITDDVWAESARDEHFHVHRDTQSVTLIEFRAHKHEVPVVQPIYAEFEEHVSPVVEHIANYYQDSGFVIRILLAKLRAGCKIDAHVDTGYSLLTVHRIHVPIITNDSTDFYVGGELKRMRAGEFWEIDNSQTHAVENNGTEDRVHMIVDWMPNHAGVGVKAAIDLVRPGGAVGQGDATPVLDKMIAQAFEHQREGKPHKAEARYRYVLDIDPDNVVCNNLMGMLCRQLQRYDEAVRYIQTAIKAAPDDAKAHVNLGQAYLMQGDFTQSANSFQNALSLNPNLESARVGLQRAQLEMDHLASKAAQ